MSWVFMCARGYDGGDPGSLENRSSKRTRVKSYRRHSGKSFLAPADGAEADGAEADASYQFQSRIPFLDRPADSFAQALKSAHKIPPVTSNDNTRRRRPKPYVDAISRRAIPLYHSFPFLKFNRREKKRNSLCNLRHERNANICSALFFPLLILPVPLCVGSPLPLPALNQSPSSVDAHFPCSPLSPSSTNGTAGPLNERGKAISLNLFSLKPSFIPSLQGPNTKNSRLRATPRLTAPVPGGGGGGKFTKADPTHLSLANV